jgi:hypothetical protein
MTPQQQGGIAIHWGGCESSVAPRIDHGHLVHWTKTLAISNVLRRFRMLTLKPKSKENRASL